MKHLLLVAFAISMLSSVGSANSDNPENTSVSTTTTRTVTEVPRKEDYIKNTDAKLNKYESKISEMRARLKAEPEGSPRYDVLNESLQRFQNDIDGAREQLADVRSAKGDDWVDHHRKLETRILDLEQTYQKTMAE